MPKRIQRRRTKGWRMPEGAVYVGRPTRYGNPFKIGQKIDDDCVPSGYIIVDAATCKELFKYHCQQMLLDDPKWLAPLCGKDLACWCPEDAEWCHANELLEMANLPDAARGE